VEFVRRGWSQAAQAGIVASSLLLVLAPQVLLGHGQGSADVAYPLSDGALHGHRVAVVKPIFTATAYSSFYTFFDENRNTPPGTHVTRPASLQLLNAHIVDTWGWSAGLRNFVDTRLKSASPAILSDLDVHQGRLFHDGSRAYDVVILGFSEYVTAAEYHQFESFVAGGGTIIFLDATQFLAEVQYHPESGTLSLVRGHGWVFDGSSAWRGPWHRWYNESTAWVGSNYGVAVSDKAIAFQGALASGGHPVGRALQAAFGKDALLFKGYRHHEENSLLNPRATIIARWQVSGAAPGTVVAAYELWHGAGRVMHTGVFGSDVVGTDPQIQYLMLSMLSYALSWYSAHGHAV
jgi:hypothetical protein